MAMALTLISFNAFYQGNPQKSGDTGVMMSVDSQQPETLENQEISANVTVVTTPSVNPEMLRPTIGQSVSHDLLLGRWRLSLDLFGRVFMEDVGLEPGSIVSELGGFPVKEAKFRRDMEKLRNNQQKDLTLSKVRTKKKNRVEGEKRAFFVPDGARSHPVTFDDLQRTEYSVQQLQQT
jgi:hypothetical protein